MHSNCGIGNELTNLIVDRKMSDQDVVSFEDLSDCLSAYGLRRNQIDKIRHVGGMAAIALFYEIVNKFPPNPSSLTYTTFGFSELPEAEHPNLVGLYKELILSLECNVAEFIMAFESSFLFGTIKYKYLSQSKGRGKFYRWLCSREDFFDSLQPQPCVIHYGVYPRSGFSQRSWPGKRIPVAYHPGDQVVTLKAMQSKIAELLPWEDYPSKSVLSKNEIAVTVLYYETLMGKLPTRCSIVYNSFGFSKVHPLDIQSLADLYKKLICDLKCGRLQFLQAYEAGGLYELIHSRFSNPPAGEVRGNCYSEWFVPRKVLFNSLKPLTQRPEYPPSAHMKTLPIPTEVQVQTLAHVHSVVADYLTEDERRELRIKKLNCCNKLAVIRLFYEALQDTGEIPLEFSRLVLPVKVGFMLDQNSNSFSLYRVLIIGLGCKVEEFLKAYENGQVMELIESKYSQLPADDRGFHYNTWFPKHKHLFKGLRPTQVPGTAPGLFDGDFDFEEELESHEHHSQEPSSETEEAVAFLYEKIRLESFPELHPTTRRCLGFDQMPSQSSGMMLFAVYKYLIVNLKCRRQTFLKAYESGKLLHLIEWTISMLKDSRCSEAIVEWFHEHIPILREIKPPFNEDGPSSPGSKLCAICNKVSTFRCGGCKAQWYCSKEHQTTDWKSHKKICASE